MECFISGCRRPSELESLLAKCGESGLKGGSYECLELDLMATKSVRKFADTILAKNLPIHVLVNNGEAILIHSLFYLVTFNVEAFLASMSEILQVAKFRQNFDGEISQ